LRRFYETAQGRASVAPVDAFALTGNGVETKRNGRRKAVKKDWVQ
jgi:hypothetical protein